METTIQGLGFRDRIWGIWGSYWNTPTAIVSLLKGDYIHLYLQMSMYV